MRLNDHEKAMLAGDLGEPRRFAIRQQMQVGAFFDAEDFVEVSHVHLMADTESLGEAGIAFLEKIAGHPEDECRVAVPTVTDPRGIDFSNYRRLNQPDIFAERERRTIRAFEALGIMLTDTCINYQTIWPPVLREHIAFGDTGSTIYANSVMGARSNFEGGPAALSAALTGRVPRYGYHLDRQRRGTRRFVVERRPQTLADWGALGGVVGKRVESYWQVPVIDGIDGPPTSDELKHFGAALASFGSVALFHMSGVTPEAPTVEAVFDGPPPAAEPVTAADIEDFYGSFRVDGDTIDVVVFAAPQLSLIEMQQLARLLDGRRLHPKTALVAATSPENKAACDRMGITAAIEGSGAIVLKGVCFYQMYARELGVANGWTRLMTNSAKLVNIIQGYDYQPVLASMERCVETAVTGRIAR